MNFPPRCIMWTQVLFFSSNTWLNRPLFPGIPVTSMKVCWLGIPTKKCISCHPGGEEPASWVGGRVPMIAWNIRETKKTTLICRLGGWVEANNIIIIHNRCLQQKPTNYSFPIHMYIYIIYIYIYVGLVVYYDLDAAIFTSGNHMNHVVFIILSTKTLRYNPNNSPKSHKFSIGEIRRFSWRVTWDRSKNVPRSCFVWFVWLMLFLLFCLIVCWLVGWLFGWLVGWWLVGWLVGWFVGWLVGWLVRVSAFFKFSGNSGRKSR